VYALSTDPLDKAQDTVNKLHLAFPVLYGLDGPKTAETLGAWYEERRNIIQPSAFILGPDRKILSVTHSSGPVGRLVAKDAERLIAFFDKQSRGG
jgi:peroxiredoxin